jgi:hypothetical protein
VPKWVRGEKETAYFMDNKTKVTIPICALGGSIATSKSGLTAEVVEVKSLKELETLGEEKLKGKIIFYNRPFEPENIDAFKSYGKCVDQRYYGAKEATKYGAVGTIVRSMNFRLDDFPHTGAQSYGDLPKEQYIPTAAISTNAAELLSKKLKENSKLKFYMKLSCQTLADVLSYNVIGEITGSVHPEKIMTVGGHLDSWDLADGSHDDGAGVVQSMAVLECFKKLIYKPKNTIRVVLFMNEENGVKGGIKYADEATGTKHIAAIESDAGGFTPRGFGLDDSITIIMMQKWVPLFQPYSIDWIKQGWGGTDIGPLKKHGTVLIGYTPDSQRYFDYHHTAIDTFDKVNKRELELGAAAISSMLYLLSEYGIGK